jgi:quinol monooxygenase YgiN
MSVIVLVKFRGDPGTVEAMMQDRPTAFETLAAEARRHGGEHHRMAVRGNEILIIDEWHSVEDFDTFYPAQPGLLQALDDLGFDAAPEVSYWDPIPGPGEF